MLAKATQMGAVRLDCVDLRQFGLGPRRQVDDTPYGGGGGMILRIEPLVAAIEAVQQQAERPTQVVLLTPRGQLFKQADARALADSDADLILLGGRYEGYDERLVHFVDQQFSIGQYVLTGAELPALVVTDAVVRLLPNVLGAPDACQNDSFATAEATIEHPQYTKPEVFRNLAVPEVLKSGHHQAIDAWRKEQTQT